MNKLALARALALSLTLAAASSSRAQAYQPNDCTFAASNWLGVVISQPVVVLHFWGAHFQGTAGARQAAQQVAAWSYIANRVEFYAPLYEYSTTSAQVMNPMTINAGSFGGSDFIATGSTAANNFITDQQVQNDLTSAGITGDVGGAPQTIHVVLLPPGVGTDQKGAAYHSSFSNTTGRRVVYAALTSPAPWVASTTEQLLAHEVYEAITDPYPNGRYAWANAALEEIADVCNAATSFNGYTIVQIYSQAACSCVGAVDPAPPAAGFSGGVSAPSCSAYSAECSGMVQITCDNPSGAPLQFLRGLDPNQLYDELGVLAANTSPAVWDDYAMPETQFYYQACAFNANGQRACSAVVPGYVDIPCGSYGGGGGGGSGGGGAPCGPPPKQACVLK